MVSQPIHPRKKALRFFSLRVLSPCFMLHSGNLTQQCKIHHLKMYFLFRWGFSIAMFVYRRVVGGPGWPSFEFSCCFSRSYRRTFRIIQSQFPTNQPGFNAWTPSPEVWLRTPKKLLDLLNIFNDILLQVALYQSYGLKWLTGVIIPTSQHLETWLRTMASASKWPWFHGW